MATIDARGAYIFDTSAAARTATLPDGAKWAGKTLGPFKRVGANVVHFHPAGTDKIDGNSADYNLTSDGSVVSFTWVGGATGWMSRIEGGAVTVSSSGATGPSNPTAGSATYRWIDHECEVTIPRTVPSPIGTYKGDHIWAEIPDQSAGTALVLGSSTLGSSKAVGEWKPLDIAKCPYNPAYPTSKDVFRIKSDLLKFKDSTTAITCRFYLNPYSDQVENPVVRAGQSGATLSVTLAIYPESVHPSGAEYGNAATTFSVVKGANDNTTGTLRTPFTATVSFVNPDPSVRGWSIWFRGDGEKWTQETAMMDLTVTSVVVTFDTPAVVRNIYFAMVLHGLSEDGTVKANSIDEAVNPPVKLSFGSTNGTLDPDAWKRDRIGSSIAVDATTGKWESIPYVSRLRAGSAIFDADVVFARGATGPRVGINSTGVDVYSDNTGAASIVSVRAADVTIRGSGLGYVKADASSVVVASGGTPKVLVASTGVTVYGAGTATVLVDATQVKLDSGTGPKATLTSSSLTLDGGSGSTPQLVLTSSNLVLSGSGGGSSYNVTVASFGVQITGPTDNPILFDGLSTVISGNRIFTSEVHSARYYTGSSQGVIFGTFYTADGKAARVENGLIVSLT